MNRLQLLTQDEERVEYLHRDYLYLRHNPVDCRNNQGGVGEADQRSGVTGVVQRVQAAEAVEALEVAVEGGVDKAPEEAVEDREEAAKDQEGV